jgi:hypothetical protein
MLLQNVLMGALIGTAFLRIGNGQSSTTRRQPVLFFCVINQVINPPPPRHLADGAGVGAAAATPLQRILRSGSVKYAIMAAAQLQCGAGRQPWRCWPRPALLAGHGLGAGPG